MTTRADELRAVAAALVQASELVPDALRQLDTTRSQLNLAGAHLGDLINAVGQLDLVGLAGRIARAADEIAAAELPPEEGTNDAH